MLSSSAGLVAGSLPNEYIKDSLPTVHSYKLNHSQPESWRRPNARTPVVFGASIHDIQRWSFTYAFLDWLQPQQRSKVIALGYQKRLNLLKGMKLGKIRSFEAL